MSANTPSQSSTRRHDVSVYATYFDERYLSRALALIESIRNGGDFSKLFALTLDSKSSLVLESLNLDNVTILHLEDLEKFEPKLLDVKHSRTRMEYIFTLTPILLKYVTSLESASDSCIYLDSDLYFFDEARLVSEEMAGADIGVIPHRYHPDLAESLERFGTFNVGWVAFRNNSNGQACLEFWYQCCLEWCRDIPEDGKYADQGYLNLFPELFQNVRVLQSAAFNLAPWNVANTNLEVFEGKVFAEGNPLVFFHFHGLKKYSNVWKTAHGAYGSKLDPILVEFLYMPYAQHLREIERRLEDYGVAARNGSRRGTGLGSYIGIFLDYFLAILGLIRGTSFWMR